MKFVSDLLTLSVCWAVNSWTHNLAFKSHGESENVKLPENSGSSRRVFVRPGTPGPLLGYFNSRPSYFIRWCLQIFIILFPVVKTETQYQELYLYVFKQQMPYLKELKQWPEMAQNAPWGLKILKFYPNFALCANSAAIFSPCY